MDENVTLTLAKGGERDVNKLRKSGNY